MSVAQRFPLDFDALGKGDVITAERIERIVGLPRGSDAYRLKLLALSRRIEDELGNRGTPVCVKEDRGGLRILTDGEAAGHTNRMAKQRLSSFARYVQKEREVDVRNLTKEEVPVHDRNLVVNGTILQAIQKTRAELAQQPTARQIPGSEGMKQPGSVTVYRKNGKGNPPAGADAPTP